MGTISQDSFFTPIGNTKPYFKAAFEGFAGCGKTYTSALVAVGLHKRIKSQKPIVIFDTEKASKFLKPLFAENGIEAIVRESRSLADLKETMYRLRNGAGDILFIDSITHIWENFLKAYAEKVRRTSLQFQDWGVIKPTWKTEFSDPFVNDPYHIIMTGRAGWDYANEINEETGKREIYKSGVKMKVEGETAYEPDVLVYMEQVQQMKGEQIQRIFHRATVKKDRSTIIHGKIFENPSYEHFSPTIEAMLENPMPRNAHLAPETDTATLFKTEEEKGEWRRERDRWIEEIDGLLTRVAPGSVGKDKQLKLDMLDKVFGTVSETAIHGLYPEQLKEGYRKIMDALVEAGHAQYGMRDGRKVLIITRINGGNGETPQKEQNQKKTRRDHKGS